MPSPRKRPVSLPDDGTAGQLPQIRRPRGTRGTRRVVRLWDLGFLDIGPPPPYTDSAENSLPRGRVPAESRGVPGSSGSHATPPNFDTPIKDGDTYPSRTRGLRGVRSPSSRGVSRIRGYPPLPDLPEALPPLPTQMVGSTFPRVSRASSDLGSPWPPRSKIPPSGGRAPRWGIIIHAYWEPGRPMCGYLYDLFGSVAPGGGVFRGTFPGIWHTRMRSPDRDLQNVP